MDALVITVTLAFSIDFIFKVYAINIWNLVGPLCIYDYYCDQTLYFLDVIPMSVMLNRLKNALAGDDVPDNSANNRQPRGRSRGPGGGSGSRGEAKRSDSDCRMPYSRPHFLHLSVDEVAASADKTSRPIILPRDVTKVPWCAGYAE